MHSTRGIVGLVLGLSLALVPSVSAQVVRVTPGSASDADDASVATGQTAPPVIGLTHAYDGSVWRRLTFGTAGTASTQVLTVQGIASMTPLNVNSTQVAGSTIVVDPCTVNTPTYTPISITTATTTRIVAPTASKRTYVCSILLLSAGTDNVGVVEGTGGTCGTGTAGVIGGTTAANGLNFTAQTGVAWGNGAAAIFATAGTNVDLCLITSAAVVLAGHVKWVAQ